jgi:hypothetical protein
MLRIMALIITAHSGEKSIPKRVKVGLGSSLPLSSPRLFRQSIFDVFRECAVAGDAAGDDWRRLGFTMQLPFRGSYRRGADWPADGPIVRDLC